MARATRSRRKPSSGRIYVITIMAFLIVVLCMQIVNLYHKYQTYDEQETSLEKQVDEANDRSEELSEYESYVGSDQYVEDQASQKLGLTHDNWIIFREKEN